MYKPSRIYFRRQEACDALALDFSTLEGSSMAEEESSKEVKRLEASKEEGLGGWTQELRERQQRGSNSENETRESQRKF